MSCGSNFADTSGIAGYDVYVIVGRNIRDFALIPLLVLAAMTLGATGCKGAADQARSNLAPKSKQKNSTEPSQSNAPNDIGVALPINRAHRILYRATHRATATDRRFAIKLSVKTSSDSEIDESSAGLMSAAELIDFSMSGYRNRNDASDSELKFGLGPISRTVGLRIINDVLFVHRDDSWFRMGSAGGLTFDVGRELFLHDSLVHVTGGQRFRDGTIVVFGRVAGDDVVNQAKSEPTGLVSAALQYTTGLRFRAVIRNRELVSDTIFAGLKIPAAAQLPLPIGSVTMIFEERYTNAAFRRVQVPPSATPIQQQGSFAELLGLNTGINTGHQPPVTESDSCTGDCL